MNYKPLVSAIVPCYNAERFLIETVESIGHQTFTKWEIILIDDGSTDNTREVILYLQSRYGDRIKAEFGTNQGASAARNRGTQIARGEFIQYVDADDLLRFDALDRRLKALITNDADVAYSDWQKLEESEDGIFYPGAIIARQIEDVHIDPEIALFSEFWAPPAAYLYRRRIVDRIGRWNESLPIIQDARFALDAALHGGKFVYVPGVGADYRITKSISLSRGDRVRFMQDIFINGCQIQAWWESKNTLNQERQAILARLYDATARHIFSVDFKMFQDNLRHLYQMQSGFNFTRPKITGLITYLIGYKLTKFLLNKFTGFE